MSRIVGLTSLPFDHRIQMEYEKLSIDPEVFIDINGNILGYIWYKISEDGHMFVEMIEMIEKEIGLGTEAIEFLFNHLDIYEISGTVLIERSMRAYWFWFSLGAELDMDPEEVEDGQLEDGISFLLRKEDVIKN